MSGMMPRDSAAEMALEGRKRGMSYGQYVAAAYYPVTVIVPVEGGEPVVHRVELPPVRPEREAERRGGTPPPLHSPPPSAGGKGRKKPVSLQVGRRCVVCGEELNPGKRTYCSEGCKKKACSQRYYQRKKAGQVKLPLGVTPVVQECAVCGGRFETVMPHQKYCGSECSHRALQIRNKLRWAAERAAKPRKQCIACGGVIADSGYKYCAGCRVQAQKENMASRGERYRQRKREEKRREQS